MATKPKSKPMLCPVCGDPITAGQRHKNTIYGNRAGISISDQAHYPQCWAACHPQVPSLQPSLFATT